MIFQGFSTIKFEVLRNDLRFIYPSNLNNQFVRNNFENSTVSKCGTPRMPPEGRAYEGEGRDWEWRSRDRRARRVIGRPGRDNRRRRGGAIKLFLAIDWSRRFPVDPSAPAQVTRAPQVVTGSKVSALDREPVNTHKNFIVTHSSFMWESQPATGLRPWFCPLEILIYPIYKKKNRLCVLHHSFSHVRIIHQHKLIKKQHLTLDNDV